MTIAVQLSLQRRSRTASLTRRRAAVVADDVSCKAQEYNAKVNYHYTALHDRQECYITM